MEQSRGVIDIPQYSLGKILLVWASAAIPMGILGWFVAPALMSGSQRPVMVRLAVLTVGLIWQFILVLILLRQETGNLNWSTFRERLWLNTPRDPKTGEKRRRLWWWIIPVFLLTAFYELQVTGALTKVWVSLLPFFAEPAGFGLGSGLATPEAKAQLKGAWDVWGLYILQAVFNTFLGEELLFRGLLLPRMAGVFGKGDWAVNGLLFGLYHLHQPWSMIDSVVEGMFLLALPTRYFRSSWFGIIAHSGQSFFFTFLLLGLVLGLA